MRIIRMDVHLPSGDEIKAMLAAAALATPTPDQLRAFTYMMNQRLRAKTASRQEEQT
jgi:hypothetical protein